MSNSISQPSLSSGVASSTIPSLSHSPPCLHHNRSLIHAHTHTRTHTHTLSIHTYTHISSIIISPSPIFTSLLLSHSHTQILSKTHTHTRTHTHKYFPKFVNKMRMQNCDEDIRWEYYLTREIEDELMNLKMPNFCSFPELSVRKKTF